MPPLSALRNEAGACSIELRESSSRSGRGSKVTRFTFDLAEIRSRRHSINGILSVFHHPTFHVPIFVAARQLLSRKLVAFCHAPMSMVGCMLVPVGWRLALHWTSFTPHSCPTREQAVVSTILPTSMPLPIPNAVTACPPQCLPDNTYVSPRSHL